MVCSVNCMVVEVVVEDVTVVVVGSISNDKMNVWVGGRGEER